MHKTDNYYIQQLLKLADEAVLKSELPIASFVVINEEIVGCAITKYKEEQRYLIHAELMALMQADKMRFSLNDRKNATLYTTLEPCLMCLGAAISFPVGKICYSLESPLDGAIDAIQYIQKNKNEIFTSWHIPEIVGGLHRNKSLHLFHKYALEIPDNTLDPVLVGAKTFAKIK